ncbi:regulatory protein RecX [Marinobacterium aestuariivivens]|uniref:Regulatory protein RecX n=1 Tax=Marinobacterium aestuariivivens TaxID=1698799 RepID=A0ABW1ZXH8_9GAMM
MYETETEIKAAAIRLLARREHSRRELEQKLAARCDSALLQEALDRLQHEGYLSDARFTASYLRSKAAQGFGPMRIRSDLGRKGIGQELWQQALDEEPVDWFEQARDLARRRFPPVARDDRQTWAKRMRYLTARGYSPDQARYALEQDDAE